MNSISYHVSGPHYLLLGSEVVLTAIVCFNLYLPNLFSWCWMCLLAQAIDVCWSVCEWQLNHEAAPAAILVGR